MPSGGPCHLIHGCTLSSPPEGASKTSMAVDVMLDDRDDYRLFHPGFLVVGCRSYDQAARKCTESIRRAAAAAGGFRGRRGAVLQGPDRDGTSMSAWMASWRCLRRMPFT